MRARKTNRRKTPLKVRVKSAGAWCVGVVRRVVPLMFLAIVAVAVPLGVFMGYLHVVSTPYFAVKDVSIKGAKLLEKDRILSIAGIDDGVNVFDVDVRRAEQRLVAYPWIRRARVEKRLPQTLNIEIEERAAAALLVDGSSYVLLDADGEPFKSLEPSDEVDELLTLPLVTGISRAEAQDEHGQELVVEAMEVVRLAKSYNLPPLSEVHIDPVMGLSIVPAESGIEIRLGRGKYSERLDRLRAVFAAIEREGRVVDYILIDQEEKLNRVTVGSRTN